MTEKYTWNVPAAQTLDDLMNVLFAAAAGLKTQAMVSPVLADPRLADLRGRISAIADELHGMQADVIQ
ncbi:MAG: hypothetical protein JSR64_04435 [Nitrospira sp.]|nr:hypothetical protein [Nitrospira sp.]